MSVKLESGYMDDDFYEDTGSMAMPDKGMPNDVRLARIPDWLYGALSNWDDLAEGNDDDQIQVGEVLAFATTGGIDNTKPMRIFFNDRWQAKTKLPTAFELTPMPTSNTMLGNTYVFSEKDLPGYKPNGYGQGGRGGAVQDPKARVQKRRYKKAIPKQTALLGQSTSHYSAKALDTQDLKDFTTARMKQAIQGSNTATVITKETDYTSYNNLQKRFESFIKPNVKTKAQQNKAARVSREELTDMLHAAFDDFQYWPMKALKTRTKQPEQFLKEGLNDIAQLVRSGPFASTWQRLPLYNEARNLSKLKLEAAPEEDGSDGEEMEDVV